MKCLNKLKHFFDVLFLNILALIKEKVEINVESCQSQTFCHYLANNRK